MIYRSGFLLSWVVALALGTSCGDEKGPVQGPPPAVAVTLTTVASSNAVFYDEYPATLSALNEIQLTSQVTGYVTSVHFRDGDKVKKGPAAIYAGRPGVQSKLPASYSRSASAGSQPGEDAQGRRTLS